MSGLNFSQKRIDEARGHAGFMLARVTSQHKNLYTIMTEDDKMNAEVSGAFLYMARNTANFPAVGDYVLVDTNTDGGNAIIHTVLERTSIFSRKAAGESDEEQILATNIDVVFICMSLNNDFNLRRLERYLAVAFDSGAQPVVVLTKADLCHDVAEKVASVRQQLRDDVRVLAVANTSDDGYTELLAFAQPNTTIAFIGSSGVGKSTLINRMLGEDALPTSDTRSDDKGRHTTTRRDLYSMPSGAMVIDTPGMRELGLYAADVGSVFEEITELARHCKFHDCTHAQEPGCAVQEAIRQGELSAERFESFQKLKKEAEYTGLDARQIDSLKTERMFADFDGKKNAKKIIRSQIKRKHPS